jgi:two-component system chemotaxis response regulator CheY
MQALIIDDSKAMRSILKRLLGEMGFGPIHEAANGSDALAALSYLKETRLILVDWNMPEMNGLEFVTAVRSNPQFNSVRLMMVTTETEIEQVQKALDAGANEYLMKPFTGEVLREKLNLLGLVSGAGA